MHSAEVTVDGVQVTYHVSGNEPPNGSTLVLVHGTGGSTATHFGHLFPMMATRTRVIGIDMSPVAQDTDLTVDALAEQVSRVIDHVLGAGSSFDLLGYSLGAVVAQAVAAKLRTRVKHLILVAGWIRTDLQQLLRNTVWEILYTSAPAALTSYTTFCAVSGRFLRQMSDEGLAGSTAQLTNNEFTRQQMQLNRGVDLTDAVGDITACTLIVSCTEDVMVPRHHQLQQLGAIPDARLTYVSSGHAIFIERPAELMQITDLFLREPQQFPTGAVIPETLT